MSQESQHQPRVIQAPSTRPDNKKTYRRWSFTINNYGPDNLDHIRSAAVLDELNVRYLIVGREVAGTGTPHLQGYVEFKGSVRLSHVKKLDPNGRIHCEQSLGNASQNIEYCSKEDSDPFIFGGSAGGSQGKRSDLDKAADIIKSGGSLKDVADINAGLVIRYHRGFNALGSLYSAKRTYPTNVVWRWGKTGTWKSRHTHEEAARVCGDSVEIVYDKKLKWFCGVTTHTKGVIFDDFDGTACLPVLLNLMDRYQCKVETKGGSTQFCARWIWITSQCSPCSYYSGDVQFMAFIRRLRDYGVVYEYTGVNQFEEVPQSHWHNILV